MKKIVNFILDIIAILFTLILIKICFKIDIILGWCSLIIIISIVIVDLINEAKKRKIRKQYDLRK